MNPFSFAAVVDPLVDLFKNAKPKKEEPQVPTTQGAIPGVADPADAYKDFMSRMPTMPGATNFDSGMASDAASSMQSALGSAGIQNTAAGMLQPGPGFTPVSIPSILDLKGMPGSAPKSNPVQDEINRAEGEWKNTGMLKDDDEDKEPPKPVTLKMMEF
jgi:hypothetical protein